MNISKEDAQKISEFLRKNEGLLEENNFTSLYEDFSPSYTPLLTYILISSGINPLDYMDKVPAAYATNLVEMQEIIIPKNVKYVKSAAFESCTNLRKVTFSEGLTKILWKAFRNTAIREIYLPDSIEIVDEDAFSHNSSLIKVSVPKTLIAISSKAFVGCSKLTEITFRGTVEDFMSSPTLPSVYFGICQRLDVIIRKIVCDDGYLVHNPRSEKLFDVHS